MFAKRRANVRNLGFCTFYKLLCVGQGKCYLIPPFANIFPFYKIPAGFCRTESDFALGTKPCGTSYNYGFAKGKTLRKAAFRYASL